jgi:hypothetical protein
MITRFELTTSLGLLSLFLPLAIAPKSDTVRVQPTVLTDSLALAIEAIFPWGITGSSTLMRSTEGISSLLAVLVNPFPTGENSEHDLSFY